MKKYFLIAFICLSIVPAFGCLILFITDGKNILVANHEDWYATDAEVSFIPARANKMGMLYFDFASEGTAQGGMNTAGLFFDGTRTPYAPYPANDKKTNCHCYIWKKILEECSTTEQAIAYAKKYKLPEIEDVHILFADKNGNSAIIGVYEGKMQIHRRSKNYQLLTNFNVTDPSYGGEEPCKRFATAEAMLQKDSSVTINNLENILSKTHQQELTAYSNIYNLSTGEVYVYNKTNFQVRIKLNLTSELKKGRHTISFSKLFL
jgi:predicted choloylglycine hydrolase